MIFYANLYYPNRINLLLQGYNLAIGRLFERKGFVAIQHNTVTLMWKENF